MLNFDVRPALLMATLVDVVKHPFVNVASYDLIDSDAFREFLTHGEDLGHKYATSSGIVQNVPWLCRWIAAGLSQ